MSNSYMAASASSVRPIIIGRLIFYAFISLCVTGVFALTVGHIQFIYLLAPFLSVTATAAHIRHRYRVSLVPTSDRGVVLAMLLLPLIVDLPLVAHWRQIGPFLLLQYVFLGFGLVTAWWWNRVGRAR